MKNRGRERGQGLARDLRFLAKKDNEVGVVGFRLFIFCQKMRERNG